MDTETQCSEGYIYTHYIVVLAIGLVLTTMREFTCHFSAFTDFTIIATQIKTKFGTVAPSTPAFVHSSTYAIFPAN